MEQFQPTCKIISTYRKQQQNWLQIGLSNTSKVENIAAQSLLMEHKNKLVFFSKEDIISITMLAQNQSIPIIETHIQPKSTNLFLILLMLQISILVASNIMSSKVMHIFGIDIVSGAICFPLLYSISDLIVELYGFKYSRKAMLLSIMSNSIIVLLVSCSILMPAAENWHNQEPYALILTSSTNIYIASMIAFACGDLINSYLLATLKESRFHNLLFFRLVFACSFGLLIDSIVFVTLAHINTLSVYSIFNMLCNVLFHKFIYEVATAWLLVHIIKKIKQRYQDLNYQPLKIKFL